MFKVSAASLVLNLTPKRYSGKILVRNGMSSTGYMAIIFYDRLSLTRPITTLLQRMTHTVYT